MLRTENASEGDALADFATLIGDIGEAARRQQACCDKTAERMAAIDQDGTSKDGGNHADDIMVKR